MERSVACNITYENSTDLIWTVATKLFFECDSSFLDNRFRCNVAVNSGNLEPLVVSHNSAILGSIHLVLTL